MAEFGANRDQSMDQGSGNGNHREHGRADGRDPLTAKAEQAANEAASAAQTVLAAGESAFDEIREAADKQRHVGAEQMGAVARAIHGVARELEPQLPDAAKLVHSAAQTIESGSTALRERGFAEMASDLRRLAHEQPLGFFGGAVLAGFAVSRFIKSSAQHPHGTGEA
jgi:hypothetical protein